MGDLAVGLLNILVGCSLIIFRKSFARAVVKGQNKTWGFNFGQREAKLSEFIAVIVGIVAIVFGIVSMFSIFM